MTRFAKTCQVPPAQVKQWHSMDTHTLEDIWQASETSLSKSRPIIFWQWCYNNLFIDGAVGWQWKWHCLRMCAGNHHLTDHIAYRFSYVLWYPECVGPIWSWKLLCSPVTQHLWLPTIPIISGCGVKNYKWWEIQLAMDCGVDIALCCWMP